MKNLNIVVSDKINDIAQQGRVQSEVEGGAIWRGGAKNKINSKRAEGVRIFSGLYSRKILWFSY